MTHQRILLHSSILSCRRGWAMTEFLPRYNVLEVATADTTVRTLSSTAWRCFRARRACLLRWLPPAGSLCCSRGCCWLFADAFTLSSSSSAISSSLHSLSLTSATPAHTSNDVHYNVLTWIIYQISVYHYSLQCCRYQLLLVLTTTIC